MGQNISNRRSYTPGKTKNTEVAWPAPENGSATEYGKGSATENGSVSATENGSVSATGVGHGVDNHEDREEVDIVTLSTPSDTPTSSSTPAGKTEKRKRFRVGFPLRRTPSGRWSRKRKSLNQNGVRPASGRTSVHEELPETTVGPRTAHDVLTQQPDMPTNGHVVHVTGLTANGGSHSNLKDQDKPAVKASAKSSWRRGSQKSSSKRKKKEKQNSNNKKKNKKQNSGGDGKVREVMMHEMTDRETDGLKDAPGEEVLAQTQQSINDAQSIAGNIGKDTGHGQEHEKTDDLDTSRDPTDSLQEHTDHSFVDNRGLCLGNHTLPVTAEVGKEMADNGRVTWKQAINNESEYFMDTGEVMADNRRLTGTQDINNDIEYFMDAGREDVPDHTSETSLGSELHIKVLDGSIPRTSVGHSLPLVGNTAFGYEAPSSFPPLQATEGESTAEVQMQEHATMGAGSLIDLPGAAMSKASSFLDVSVDDTSSGIPSLHLTPSVAPPILPLSEDLVPCVEPSKVSSSIDLSLAVEGPPKPTVSVDANSQTSKVLVPLELAASNEHSEGSVSPDPATIDETSASLDDLVHDRPSHVSPALDLSAEASGFLDIPISIENAKQLLPQNLGYDICEHSEAMLPLDISAVFGQHSLNLGSPSGQYSSKLSSPSGQHSLDLGSSSGQVSILPLPLDHGTVSSHHPIVSSLVDHGSTNNGYYQVLPPAHPADVSDTSANVSLPRDPVFINCQLPHVPLPGDLGNYANGGHSNVSSPLLPVIINGQPSTGSPANLAALNSPPMDLLRSLHYDCVNDEVSQTSRDLARSYVQAGSTLHIQSANESNAKCLQTFNGSTISLTMAKPWDELVRDPCPVSEAVPETVPQNQTAQTFQSVLDDVVLLRQEAAPGMETEASYWDVSPTDKIQVDSQHQVNVLQQGEAEVVFGNVLWTSSMQQTETCGGLSHGRKHGEVAEKLLELEVPTDVCAGKLLELEVPTDVCAGNTLELDVPTDVCAGKLLELEVPTDVCTGNTMELDVPTYVCAGKLLELDVPTDVCAGNTLELDVPTNVCAGNTLELDVPTDVCAGNTLELEVPTDVCAGNTLELDVPTDVCAGKLLELKVPTDVCSGNTLELNVSTDVCAGNTLELDVPTDVCAGDTLELDVPTDVCAGNTMELEVPTDLCAEKLLELDVPTDVCAGNTLELDVPTDVCAGNILKLEVPTDVRAGNTLELGVPAGRGDTVNEIVQVKVTPEKPGVEGSEKLDSDFENDLNILEINQEKCDKRPQETEHINNQQKDMSTLNTETATHKQRKDKEQRATGKKEKGHSKGKKLMKFQRKLTDWFHKTDKKLKADENDKVETPDTSDDLSKADGTTAGRSALMKAEEPREATEYSQLCLSTEIQPGISAVSNRDNFILHFKREEIDGATSLVSSHISDEPADIPTPICPSHVSSEPGSIPTPTNPRQILTEPADIPTPNCPNHVSNEPDKISTPTLHSQISSQRHYLPSPICHTQIPAEPADTPTPSDPTSFSSDTNRLASPSSDGEGSNFLKKISLGPRLRTAILRKKSTDSPEGDGEEKRISLTRPKSIGARDLTPSSLKLSPREPVVQSSPSTNRAHNRIFMFGVSNYDIHTTSLDTISRPTSVTSSIDFNNSCDFNNSSYLNNSCDLNSSCDLNNSCDFNNSCNFNNSCVPENTSPSLADDNRVYVSNGKSTPDSCAPVSKSVTDSSSEASKNWQTPVVGLVSHHEEEHTCPLLDASINDEDKDESDKTTSFNSVAETKCDRLGISDPKAEFIYQNPVSPESTVEITQETSVSSLLVDGVNCHTSVFSEPDEDYLWKPVPLKSETDLSLKSESDKNCHKVELNCEQLGLHDLDAGLRCDNKTVLCETVGAINCDNTVMSESQAEVTCDRIVICELQTDINCDKTMMSESQEVTCDRIVICELQTDINCGKTILPEPRFDIKCNNILISKPEAGINCDKPFLPEPDVEINCDTPVLPEPDVEVYCDKPVLLVEPDVEVHCDKTILGEPNVEVNCDKPVLPEPDVEINRDKIVVSKSEAGRLLEPKVEVHCDKPDLPEPYVDVHWDTPVLPEPVVEVQWEKPVLPESVVEVNCDTPVLPEPAIEVHCDKPVLPEVEVRCDTPVLPEPDVEINCDKPVLPEPAIEVNCDKPVLPEVEVRCDTPVLPEPDVEINCDKPVLPEPDDEINCDKPVLPEPDVEINCVKPVLPEPDVEINCDKPVLPEPEVEVHYDTPVLPEPEVEVHCNKPVLPEPEVEVHCNKPVLPEPEVEVHCNKPVLPKPEIEVHCNKPVLPEPEVEVHCDKPVLPEPEVEINCDKAILSEPEIICDKRVLPEPETAINCDKPVLPEPGVEVHCDKLLLPEPEIEAKCDRIILPDTKVNCDKTVSMGPEGGISCHKTILSEPEPGIVSELQAGMNCHKMFVSELQIRINCDKSGLPQCAAAINCGGLVLTDKQAGISCDNLVLSEPESGINCDKFALFESGAGSNCETLFLPGPESGINCDNLVLPGSESGINCGNLVLPEAESGSNCNNLVLPEPESGINCDNLVLTEPKSGIHCDNAIPTEREMGAINGSHALSSHPTRLDCIEPAKISSSITAIPNQTAIPSTASYRDACMVSSVTNGETENQHKVPQSTFSKDNSISVASIVGLSGRLSTTSIFTWSRTTHSFLENSHDNSTHEHNQPASERRPCNTRVCPSAERMSPEVYGNGVCSISEHVLSEVTAASSQCVNGWSVCAENDACPTDNPRKYGQQCGHSGVRTIAEYKIGILADPVEDVTEPWTLTDDDINFSKEALTSDPTVGLSSRSDSALTGRGSTQP